MKPLEVKAALALPEANKQLELNINGRYDVYLPFFYNIKLIKIQNIIPNSVGSTNDIKVHFIDRVSAFIVRHVVEQGQ